MTKEDQKIYDDIRYFLNNNGVGKGTNTTLSLCAWLIKEYASLKQKELFKQPLYAFLYNPMIHESGYITVSIHRTRKGAEIAMAHHMEAERNQWEAWNKCDIAYRSEFPFNWNKNWVVEEIEIQD